MKNRTWLVSIAAAAVLAGGALFASQRGADEPATAEVASIDFANATVLSWEDLLPEGETSFVPPDAASDFPDMQASPFPSSEMGGEVGPMTVFTPPPAEARQDLADTAVKIAGYMTPLAVENGMTRTFLLVPYVGACIHVPAPPSNQIVLVEAKEPIEVRKMWEPFVAAGILRVENISTGLADVSYTMDLGKIEPYSDG